MAAIRTEAVVDGDDYVINGSKMWITNGMQADWCCLLANTGDGQVHKNKSLIMVPMDTKGIERQKIHKIGMHSSDTAQLFFDNVRVPRRNLVGQEGMGFTMQMLQFQEERLWCAASVLVSLDRIIDQTIEYTRERKAFGKAVIDFQNTQFKLAELKSEATMARVFVDQCVAQHLKGELTTVTASMAKYLLSDLQCKVMDECLQLHGGYGYMNEYPIARMFRDARVQRIYGGTNEIMKLLIARSL